MIWGQLATHATAKKEVHMKALGRLRKLVPFQLSDFRAGEDQPRQGRETVAHGASRGWGKAVRRGSPARGERRVLSPLAGLPH